MGIVDGIEMPGAKRRTRRRVVAALCVVAGLLTPARGDAGCNIFPSARSALAEFHGARGALESPFVIPRERLRITRPCTENNPPPFPSTADDARTVVIVRPREGAVRALVLKKGQDGPCDGSDDFTRACQTALGKNVQAECVSVSRYTAESGVVEIEFPVPSPSASPVRTTSARAAVALVSKGDAGTVCGALAGGTCQDAIKDQPQIAACIDEIKRTDDEKPCVLLKSDPIFPETTLLPLPNDLYEVCRVKHDGDSFCADQLVNELRYGLDRPGNLLVPMRWATSLGECPKGTRLGVKGELKAPRLLDIPDNNSDAATRNDWLRSFTFDGQPNNPPFSKGPDSAVEGFLGTTDEPFSVLRFGVRFGVCTPESKVQKCDLADTCKTGDVCEPRCVVANDSCNHSCPSTVRCGNKFHWEPEYDDGRWRLDRKRGRRFCEKDPARTCFKESCESGDECVSYLLTAGPCGKTFRPWSPPSSSVPTQVGPLVGAAVAKGGSVQASAYSDEVLALIAHREELTSAARARCPAGEGDVLFIARVAECSNESCQFFCPLDPAPLLPRLAIHGTQVRVLQRTAGDASSDEYALLRIVDAIQSTPIPVTVGEVVTNRGYDPLGIEPSGASMLLRKGGRCVVKDEYVDHGRILGIPSSCDPNLEPRQCPKWAECKASDVVIAMDLVTDRDDNGVPDSFRPRQ